MTQRLKSRSYPIAERDLDWYIVAYMRAAHRLEQERDRRAGLNTERLERKLQYLYEHIVEGLAADERKREKARAARLAIHRVITDYGLPRAMRMPLPLPDDEDQGDAA
jgi:hypothetical protein